MIKVTRLTAAYEFLRIVLHIKKAHCKFVANLKGTVAYKYINLISLVMYIYSFTN